MKRLADLLQGRVVSLGDFAHFRSAASVGLPSAIVCCPIENIVFRNLYAEDCHTAIRMLSFVSPIRNIRFENVVAGCRVFAINVDAARYCRTPLFKDEDFAEGVGCVENIEIDGLKVWWSTPGKRKALIDCENRVKNFAIRHFVRDSNADRAPEVATLVIDKTPGVRIVAKDGESTLLEQTSSSERITLQQAFSELELG